MRAALDDLRFMDAALAQAFQALGASAPNPAVGCVLVKDGRVIAAAATAPGGRPHAEARALEIAGEAARGATAYVSLEPCAHHGRTPPCAEALIAAGIARAVIACEDPFPQVAGRGIDRLQAAGIAVTLGVRQAEAEALNAGFFTRLRTGRPLAAWDPRASLFDVDLSADPAAAGPEQPALLARLGERGITRVRLPRPSVSHK